MTSISLPSYIASIILGAGPRVAHEHVSHSRSCFDIQGRKYDDAACYFTGNMSERVANCIIYLSAAESDDGSA